ncbi:MAG: flagellar basal body L-ring protein FlgH [bacterium]
MRKYWIAIGLIIMAAALLSPPARATSLWDDHRGNLYSDNKARYVGDLVTILVRESTTATNKGSTGISQKEEMSSGIGSGFLSQFLEAFGIESEDKYSGDGSTTSSGVLNTTITAEVVEVLPNGNLIVEARRSMAVNNDTQMMVLSGIIRPKDISRDNMIASTKLSDVQLRYTGKGPIARRQKPGILNKIFDWIF